MTAMETQGVERGRAVLFTYQYLAPNSRKTGMLFIAEALSSLNFATHVVTVQFSLLTYFSRTKRAGSIDPRDILRWRKRGDRLWAYVWLAALHPVSAGAGKMPFLGRWLSKIYPMLLPRSVIDEVRKADIIIIESCVAVSLFERLKRIAPKAKFIYCASDRLGIVGMHPYMSELLEKSASEYDLVRIPARIMREDFPPSANVRFLPHGLDKAAFETASLNPFAAGTTNAIIAGDMNSDVAAIEVMARDFPHVTFHVFGKLHVEKLELANVKNHGEVPFSVLASYIRYADVGIAPYSPRPGAEYLSQSSLKIIQYTYCRLPIVAPSYVKDEKDHVCAYDAASEKSISEAFGRALQFDRASIDNSGISTWRDMVESMLDDPMMANPSSAAQGAVAHSPTLI